MLKARAVLQAFPSGAPYVGWSVVEWGRGGRCGGGGNLITPVVRECCARDALPHTFDIGVFKCS